MTRGSMHRRRGAIVAGLCLPFAFLAAQVPAASAGAAPTGPPSAHVLYVTPDGDGTSCSPARPCSIEGAQTQVRQLDKNMLADEPERLAGSLFAEASNAPHPAGSCPLVQERMPGTLRSRRAG
jgi:hypothetical protein